MSNTLAIATVTSCLQSLLQETFSSDSLAGVSGTDVKIGKPFSTTTDQTKPQVNIYLYQVSPNVAFANSDVPTRNTKGDLIQRVRLGLNLNYLFSFYGDEQAYVPQRLLADTSLVLHQKPLLTPSYIRKVINQSTQTFLKKSDLDKQIELVKFTPISYSLEELSKLWSVFFQTTYTLSIAYQASVVLIEDQQTPVCSTPVKEGGVAVSLFIPPTSNINTPKNVQLFNAIFDMKYKYVGADVRIEKASSEDNIDYYSLYWGKSATQKVDKQIAIAQVKKTGSNLTYTIPSGTVIPNGATHILAIAGNKQGEMQYGTAVSLFDNLPKATAKKLTITSDTDPNWFEISLKLSLQRADDETSIGSYVLYWSANGKDKLATSANSAAQPIVVFPVRNSACKIPVTYPSTILQISETPTEFYCEVKNLIIPNNAKYFIVYSRNDVGEMPIGVTAEINDTQTAPPNHTAEAVTFTGTVVNFPPASPSTVTGKVTIDKALDDRDVELYNLYWGYLKTGTQVPIKLNNTPIIKMPKQKTPLEFKFPNQTALPKGAQYFLVYTENKFGEMTKGVYTNIFPISN